MAMEEKDKILGKLLVNFANSKSPEKAQKGLRKKVEKLFPKKKDKIIIVIDDFYEAKKAKLRKLLDELSTITNLHESSLVEEYIQLYNAFCAPSVILDEKGIIKSKIFLHKLNEIKYEHLLAYSVVRFLMHFEVNKQYIHHCKYTDCEKMFLSKQKGTRAQTCFACRHRNDPEKISEYYEQNRKNDARGTVKEILANFIKEKRKDNAKCDINAIKMRFDDDRKFLKLLDRSEWTFEIAHENAELYLKNRAEKVA